MSHSATSIPIAAFHWSGWVVSATSCAGLIQPFSAFLCFWQVNGSVVFSVIFRLNVELCTNKTRKKDIERLLETKRSMVHSNNTRIEEEEWWTTTLMPEKSKVARKTHCKTTIKKKMGRFVQFFSIFTTSNANFDVVSRSIRFNLKMERLVDNYRQ